MQLTIIFAFAFCAIGAVWAHPMPVELILPKTPEPHYPLNLEGGGGGQRGDGLGFKVRGHENVWTSDNKRHEVDVRGEYGQHLGGRYGTTEPRWEVGGTYRYRFPNF
ncbi:diptericin A [Drosophila ficusphila]|uniref:diptericin A n=1 Tax=Drosophila ficusphila TaxID=30025 RepID=UPI0007E713CA|nr:diptericin A [Drosophila ficusphila]